MWLLRVRSNAMRRLFDILQVGERSAVVRWINEGESRNCSVVEKKIQQQVVLGPDASRNAKGILARAQPLIAIVRCKIRHPQKQ